MVSSAALDDGRVTETDSEPEEGEITDSHSEASCEEEEECPSGASATAAESEEEGACRGLVLEGRQGCWLQRADSR